MKNYEVKTLVLNNGETIAYREAGQGSKTVVLVHGNMSSSVHFQTTMEALENEYKVYAVDMRGFGDSSYNNELNSLRDFSEDIQLWVNALDLKDFNILGWSTGGGVVLELAADMPERVNKVFLLDSVGIKGYPMFKKDEKGQPILTQLITTKEEIKADPVQVVPILTAYATRNKDLLKMIWNAVIYNTVQPNEEDYDAYLEAMLKQRNLVDVDYSLVHFNMTSEQNLIGMGSGRMALIKAPVVILHGKNDYVVPFNQAEEMKQVFGEQAVLIPFEGGHSLPTDCFDAYIKVLKEHFV
jgi:pimeloyl-ACP methyl ester carboxylesterase